MSRFTFAEINDQMRNRKYQVSETETLRVDLDQDFDYLIEHFDVLFANDMFFCHKFILAEQDTYDPIEPRVIFAREKRKSFDDLQPNFTKANVIRDFKQHIRLFRFDDFPKEGNQLVRYFMVYSTPELRRRYQENPEIEIPVNLFIHPVGQIKEKQEDYYNQSTNSVIPYYYLGIAKKYVWSNLAIQHRYAIKHVNHKDTSHSIPALLVFPIFSGSAYDAFPCYSVGKGKKNKNEKKLSCIEQIKQSQFSILELMIDLVKKIFPTKKEHNIGYLSVSGFSYGCTKLTTLFECERTRIHPVKSELIRAVFMFDPGKEYHFFNKNNWLNEHKDNIYKEYAAGDHHIKKEVEQAKNSKSTLYRERNLVRYNKYYFKHLKNPLEFYTRDKKKYLFLFPQYNFTVYTENPDIRNASGLNLSPLGHGWFYEHFLTHALKNSKFP